MTRPPGRPPSPPIDGTAQRARVEAASLLVGSDYRLAKVLRVSRSLVSAWRLGQRRISPKIVLPGEAK